MCPGCGSSHVRRSRRQGMGDHLYSWIKYGWLPYRCSQCETRFWALRKAVIAAVDAAPADGPVPTPKPVAKPFSLPSYKKGTVRSSQQSSRWGRLQSWIGRSTGLSFEVLFLFALIACGFLVGVWYVLDLI